MTELGLVLLALLLAEGLRLAPLRSVGFSGRPWGGYSARRPERLRDDARRGLLLPDPWLPALERFVAHAWPFALSPAGVAFLDVEERGAGTSRPANARLSWGEAGTVRIKGSRLTFGGRSVAEAGSPRAARSLADLLHRLARETPDRREAQIRAAIAENLDAVRACERLKGLRRALVRGSTLAWFLTANLLITGPVVADAIGRARVWPVWVAVHVVLTVLAARVFVRATRELGDLAPQSRLETLVSLVLYPPATARFLGLISPDVLTGLDPLAGAAALLDRDGFIRIVRDRLGALHSRPLDEEVESWFRPVLRREILALAQREGLQREVVLASPPREPGSDAFCPMCRTQYRSGTSRCTDCPGVELVRFGTATAVESNRARGARNLLHGRHERTAPHRSQTRP